MLRVQCLPVLQGGDQSLPVLLGGNWERQGWVGCHTAKQMALLENKLTQREILRAPFMCLGPHVSCQPPTHLASPYSGPSPTCCQDSPALQPHHLSQTPFLVFSPQDTDLFFLFFRWRGRRFHISTLIWGDVENTKYISSENSRAEGKTSFSNLEQEGKHEAFPVPGDATWGFAPIQDGGENEDMCAKL